MTRSLDIELETLTPLWTGGCDGKVDRIHETGILGSLRWWCEAMVRGVGGWACDPTEDKCTFDMDKYRRSKREDPRERLREAGLCDVCQIFGATGWQRRFRLEVLSSNLSPSYIKKKIKINGGELNGNEADKQGDSHVSTWYFPNDPLTGKFKIRLVSLFSDFDPKIMGGLIRFIADWAALGARTQMGFGVVKVLSPDLEMKPFWNWLFSIPSNSANRSEGKPSICEMFFACIRLDKAASENETFKFKYQIRRLFENDANLRHFIMGSIKPEKIAAKIKISRPYTADANGDKEIRLWGWIPEKILSGNTDWTRKKILDDILARINSSNNKLQWKILGEKLLS